MLFNTRLQRGPNERLVSLLNVLTWKQRQAPEYPPVGGARRWLAAAAALMLILTLTPIPFTITAG